MRYEDQPLCETCASRYPDAGIRHPPNHVEDAWPPLLLGLFALLFAPGFFGGGHPWVGAILAVIGAALLWLAGSIFHHEMVDRPRFRSRR